MSNDSGQQRCLRCPRSIPDSAYHFSNIVAHKHGFCSWTCMITELGQEATLKALNTEKEEARKRL